MKQISEAKRTPFDAPREASAEVQPAFSLPTETLKEHDVRLERQTACEVYDSFRQTRLYLHIKFGSDVSKIGRESLDTLEPCIGKVRLELWRIHSMCEEHGRVLGNSATIDRLRYDIEKVLTSVNEQLDRYGYLYRDLRMGESRETADRKARHSTLLWYETFEQACSWILQEPIDRSKLLTTRSTVQTYSFHNPRSHLKLEEEQLKILELIQKDMMVDGSKPGPQKGFTATLSAQEIKDTIQNGGGVICVGSLESPKGAMVVNTSWGRIPEIYDEALHLLQTKGEANPYLPYGFVTTFFMEEMARESAAQQGYRLSLLGQNALIHLCRGPLMVGRLYLEVRVKGANPNPSHEIFKELGWEDLGLEYEWRGNTYGLMKLQL